MQKKDRAASGLPNFPQLEEEVLEQWKTDAIFQKTLEQTATGPRFVFFEGPPTANGRPGIHHVLARVFKDVIPRYKTMRGFFVERKAGWDTHGLPVELEVEKQLGLKSKRDIEAYGVQKFNEVCRTSVWKYKKEWEELTERIGFWLDLEHPYVTYDPAYVESLWWIIRQIWDKQLLAAGRRVIPFCWRCGTGLSSHELAQGYKKVKDTSVFVRIKVKNTQDTYLLVWTTTPWTLPSNVALAVNPNIEYIKIAVKGFNQVSDGKYILSKKVYEDKNNPVSVLFRGLQNTPEQAPPAHEKREIILGSKLSGLEYDPLYRDFYKTNKPQPVYIYDKAFQDPKVSVVDFSKAFKIYASGIVTESEGTGILHISPAHGEEDFEFAKVHGIPSGSSVNEQGVMNVGSVAAGKHFSEANQIIIDDLDKRNILIRSRDIEHEYPFCWRCDNRLIYLARSQWFILMSKLKEELKQRNATINWIPDHIKDGRFGEWLNEVKDWAFSRERYWGTPLPIWVCEKDPSHKVCIGSFDELRKLAASKLPEPFDPHRPYVDDVVLNCPEGDGTMRRVKELCDVWFDSGSMPYAQWHYPFENAGRVDDGISYPADYISEAIDQTRGWFYTLLAVATLLGKAAPYKNVISLGHILDAEGQKMSKSKGNIVDPWSVINEYGADALRLHLLTMNQPGEYKLFDPKQVGEVVRKTFLILWNVLSFRDLFAADAKPLAAPATHLMDRWLVARTIVLQNHITDALERYALTEAGRAITEYVTELSTWYVRRSRARFKAGDAAAAPTLTAALHDLAVLLAPFTPMLAELVYRHVGGDKASVHLEPWPTTGGAADESLLSTMSMVRRLIEAGHALREEEGIKVRQPLPQVVLNGISLKEEYLAILRDELNIKEVHVANIPTGREWVKKLVPPVIIALDTTITDELMAEGWFRDVVRQVNDLRKKARLTLADRVTVRYTTHDDQIRAMLAFYDERIRAETRASAVQPADATPEGAVTMKLGSGELTVAIAH